MGDIADDIFNKIEEDKIFSEECPIHRVTYDNRFGCHMCEDGEPPYNEKLEELLRKGYLVVL